MSDHYCCRQCGQRYDVCRCPSTPEPPDRSLEQWYVTGPEFKVVRGTELEHMRRNFSTAFDTKEQAELHAYQSIGSRMVELQEEIERLRVLRTNHVSNRSK